MLKLDDYITQRLTNERAGVCTQAELDRVWAAVGAYHGKTVREVTPDKCNEIAVLLAKCFEGQTSHMYCDHLGKVTIGVGLLVDDEATKSRLDGLYMTGPSGAEATKAEKEKDWQACKDLFDDRNTSKPAPGAESYAAVTKCRLSSEESGRACKESMAVFAKDLFNSDFSNTNQHKATYLDYPAIAWALLINLAFALGNKGANKFVNLNAAFKAKDWTKAAKESWVSAHSRLTLGARYELLMLCGDGRSGGAGDVTYSEPTETFNLGHLSQDALYDHLRGCWIKAQKRFGNEGKPEYAFDDAEDHVNLLGARGFDFQALIPVPSTNTKYDDCMFLIYKTGGKKTVSAFQCSTEWTANDSKSVIVLGQHKFWMGVIHGSRTYVSLADVKTMADINGKGYRTLCPDPSVTCVEETDASKVGSVGDGAGRHTYQDADICIHYGGEVNTVKASRANEWSKGCQVLSGIVNFLRFIKIIETDPSIKGSAKNELAPRPAANGKRSLIYTLVEGDFLTPRVASIGFPVALGAGRAASPENAVAFYAHTELEHNGGYFPLGANTVWHGGVHLHVPMGTGVVAPFKGKIVAARLPEGEKNDTHYGSKSFILLMHEIDGATLNKMVPPGKIVGYRALTARNLRSKPSKSGTTLGELAPDDRVDLVDDDHVSAEGLLWSHVVVKRAKDTKLQGQKGYVAVSADAFRSYVEKPVYTKLDETKKYKLFSLYMHLNGETLDAKNPAFGKMEWIHAPTPPLPPASTDTLSAAVGVASPNFGVDVGKVQKRLAVHGHYAGAPTSVYDAATKNGILAFQTARLAGTTKKPDGRIDAGGAGWKALCQPPKPKAEAEIVLDANIVKGLRAGGVVKLDKDVEAGDLLWTSGHYGALNYRTGMIHWEIFSEECLLPWAPWKVQDMDHNLNMDCKEILKKVNQDAASWSYFDENEILSLDELHQFYKSSPEAVVMRSYACRFMSEWAVDLALALPQLKGRYNTWGLESRMKPLLWWSEAASNKVPLPADARVWHYNPITFLYRLALASGDVVHTPPPQTQTQTTIQANPQVKTQVVSQVKQPTPTRTEPATTTKFDGTVIDGKLSEHFKMADMVRSEAAAKLRKKEAPTLAPGEKTKYSNEPPPAHAANLKALSENMLEKIWDHYGGKLNISSGYRSAEVNAAVGGSTTSQHMSGQAADFTIEGHTVKEVFNWIAFDSGLPFDQIIYEWGRWVHVSYSTTQSRKDIKEAYTGTLKSGKQGTLYRHHTKKIP